MAVEMLTGGDITFLKANELEEGEVLQGYYMRKKENKFSDDKKKKYNHFFNTEDGETVCIGDAGNLAHRMSLVRVGDYVHLYYKGMVPATGGNYKGTPTHTFEIGVDREKELKEIPDGEPPF